MRTSILLSLSALLLMVVIAACASATQEPRVVVTVMAARIGGILVEEEGCLRITGESGTGGQAVVWQKDIHRIERRGDTFLFSNLYDDEAQPVTWRLGGRVVGGGGLTGAQVADDHAGAGFSERCPGPYFLVGMVD